MALKIWSLCDDFRLAGCVAVCTYDIGFIVGGILASLHMHDAHGTSFTLSLEL